MKYYVSFQELPKGSVRPIDHLSHADHQLTADSHAMIPNVGDYVQLEPVNNPDAPRYSGKVKSRLFRYIGDTCGVNIIVEENNDDWGLLIKE